MRLLIINIIVFTDVQPVIYVNIQKCVLGLQITHTEIKWNLNEILNWK